MLSLLTDWKIKHWFNFKVRRPIRHWIQRRTRGFDDSDTWSLDWTFIEWIVPRLKRLHEIQKNCIERSEEEIAEFEEMISLFERVMKDQRYFSWKKEVDEEVDRAMELFSKHFRSMWW